MTDDALYEELAFMRAADRRGDAQTALDTLLDLTGECDDRQWRIVQGYLEWEWYLTGANADREVTRRERKADRARQPAGEGRGE